MGTRTDEELNALPDSLVNNPWRSINNYYEEIYPNAGGKVFRFASLQAISAFAPKFTVKGKAKRIVINIMILGNSGSGKTSIMEDVEEITPKSYHVSHVSDALLEYDMAYKGKDGITLVVNDLERVMKDKDVVKAFEALIGDGRVNRKNTQNEVEEDDLNVSMIGGAVPADVTGKTVSGFLFRVVPILVKYSKTEEKDEAAEVGEHIVMGAGEDTEIGISQEHIKKYYQTLYSILTGESTDCKQPVGYHISDRHKKQIYNTWNGLRNKGYQHDNLNWYRELEDGLRFMCLSAVLNTPNRNKVNIKGEPDKCLLEVTDEDARRACALMKYEMSIKYRYVQKHLAKQVSDLGELDANSNHIDEMMEL